MSMEMLLFSSEDFKREKKETGLEQTDSVVEVIEDDY